METRRTGASAERVQTFWNNSAAELERGNRAREAAERAEADVSLCLEEVHSIGRALLRNS